MNAITVFGVLALTFMMAMYSIEQRHRGYTLAFAFGCLLSSGYGFVIGAWPFGVVEIIWCAVALVFNGARINQPPTEPLRQHETEVP
jgi:CBS-domain-containing membrane protein